MKVDLRELSSDDGKDVFDMLKEIGPGENGFVNSEDDITVEQHSDYLEKYKNMSLGINLPIGYVPMTVYWLYIDGYPVGIGRVRHYLNDRLRAIGGHIGYSIRPSERGKGYGNLMLKELLVKAAQKGIEEALIVAGETNIVSRKVIEANGGRLNEIRNGDCFYWTTTQ